MAGGVPMRGKSTTNPKPTTLCSSPLNRMSVSSAAALDLDPQATSAGFVPGLIRGWERSDRLAKPNTARGGAAKQTVGRHRSNGYVHDPHKNTVCPITAHKKCPDLSTGAFRTTLQNHQAINAKPRHSPPTLSANAQTEGRTTHVPGPQPPTCQ